MDDKKNNNTSRTSLNLDDMKLTKSVIRKKSDAAVKTQSSEEEIVVNNIKQINKNDILNETNGGNSQIIPNGNVENKQKLQVSIILYSTNR